MADILTQIANNPNTNQTPGLITNSRRVKTCISGTFISIELDEFNFLFQCYSYFCANPI